MPVVSRRHSLSFENNRKINCMEKVSKYSIAFSLLAGVIIAGYVGMRFLAIFDRQTTIQARASCAQSSRYQVTQADGAIVWYPVQDLYEACLAENGVK
jgi:hypothetical protein